MWIIVIFLNNWLNVIEKYIFCTLWVDWMTKYLCMWFYWQASHPSNCVWGYIGGLGVQVNLSWYIYIFRATSNCLWLLYMNLEYQVTMAWSLWITWGPQVNVDEFILVTQGPMSLCIVICGCPEVISFWNFGSVGGMGSNITVGGVIWVTQR